MKKPIPAHIRVHVFHHNSVLRCGVLAVQPTDTFDNVIHVVVDFDFTGALVFDDDFTAGEGFRFQP